MNLPQTTATKIVWNHRGETINFRKLSFGEVRMLQKMEKEGQDAYFDFIYELLANLLYGYTETFEERLAFIKSLEFDDLIELMTEINKLLFLLGMPKPEKKRRGIDDFTRVIAYVVSKTGWTLEYINSLEYQVVLDLLTAFTEMDDPESKKKKHQTPEQLFYQVKTQDNG